MLLSLLSLLLLFDVAVAVVGCLLFFHVMSFFVFVHLLWPSSSASNHCVVLASGDSVRCCVFSFYLLLLCSCVS